MNNSKKYEEKETDEAGIFRDTGSRTSQNNHTGNLANDTQLSIPMRNNEQTYDNLMMTIDGKDSAKLGQKDINLLQENSYQLNLKSFVKKDKMSYRQRKSKANNEQDNSYGRVLSENLSPKSD